MKVDAAEARARAAAGDLLGPAEFAAILRIGRSQFRRREQAGAFEAFKVRIKLGPKQYSGVLVTRYLAGEALYVPTFGRKRA